MTELRTYFGVDSRDPAVLDRTMNEDPRWASTRYLVEATDYEKHARWCFRAKASPWRCNVGNMNDVEWTSTTPGYSFIVGTLEGRPDKRVCVCLQWDYLDGALVCFWYATSRVVDYDMIEAWLKKKFQNIYRWTNAQNLHNVIFDIREKRA